MHSFLKVFTICSLLSVPAFSINKTDPVIIHPVVINSDSIPNINKHIRIFVGNFTDNTAAQSNGTIGTTRTGIKTSAPIIVKPSLSESLQKSFENVLGKKGNLSKDASTANYILNITISDCTVTENSSAFSQTLTVFLKLEVKLTDPLAADKPRTFTVESHNSTKALDTSKYAESTLRDAITSTITEIIKSINK